MDWETPVDAWYVWFGVAVASLAIAGVVLSLPTQPPPDATRAANAVDRVAGSTHVAAATVDHQAEEIRLGTSRLWMRNDGGTAHATIAFGPVTPVGAVDDATAREALRLLLDGLSATTVLDRAGFDTLTESELREAADSVGGRRNDSPAWRPAGDELQVRSVSLAGEIVVLVGA